MRSNSHIILPRHLHLADLDGDGSDELIQVAGNRLLVSRVNAESTGVLHAWFTSPIRRVITGRFTITGRIPHSEQLVLELADGSLRALSASDDRQELWWWFTQRSFLRRGEDVIVGDFDGDGRDELLVQTPDGALRCYTPGSGGPFVPQPDFAIGNLDRENLRGKELYAGEFGQQTGRSDLVVIDRDGGRLSRYDSATDRGKRTFWWAFTTAAGVLGRSDEIRVANIEGGSTDGLIIRNRAAGTYRLLRLDYNGGHLGTATGAAVGQLPVVTGPATMVTTKVKEAPLRRGRHESARHDVLLFDRTAGRLTRTDARHDPTAQRDTCWFAFSGPTPGRDTGWPTRPADDRWAVIRSKLSDTRQRGDTDFYQRLFTRPGGGAMVDYFMDISYGLMDLSHSDVYPADDRTEWYDCGYTTANSPRGPSVRDPYDNVEKEARAVIFGAAVRASGVDLDRYGHAVAVFNIATPRTAARPLGSRSTPAGCTPRASHRRCCTATGSDTRSTRRARSTATRGTS